MDSKSFLCFQCSDELGGKGCTKVGVCGKKADVARMQDLLIFATKGISALTTQLRAEGKPVKPRVNHLVTMNLFMTITNANFDLDAFVGRVEQTLKTKAKLLAEIDDKKNLPAAALWTDTQENFDAKADTVGILATANEDISSLRELITYGLKGLAAYLYHANALGYDDEKINAFAQSTLAKLLNDSLSGDDLTALALETGKFGVDVMALLDKANTETDGNPEVTKVKLSIGKNPAILINGHDLRDLEQVA